MKRPQCDQHKSFRSRVSEEGQGERIEERNALWHYIKCTGGGAKVRFADQANFSILNCPAAGYKSQSSFVIRGKLRLILEHVTLPLSHVTIS
jgi:hypothetical protein